MIVQQFKGGMSSNPMSMYQDCIFLRTAPPLPSRRKHIRRLRRRGGGVIEHKKNIFNPEHNFFSQFNEKKTYCVGGVKRGEQHILCTVKCLGGYLYS